MVRNRIVLVFLNQGLELSAFIDVVKRLMES